MNLYSDAAVLEAQLNILAGKDNSERKLAADKIKFHVEAAARELSLERFSNFENQLYRQIFSFVRGDSIFEKTGGILAIRALIDCTSASAEGKIMKFASTLSVALKNSTDFALITLVAESLGHMARYSTVANVEFVEAELSRALEWLRGDIPHARFAACEVLQQLADNAPTIFFVRISEFFEVIWGPLRDVKDPIRFAAGRALSACLAVLKQRTYHLQWYFNIYEQIHEGFKKNVPESIHGSLLVTKEVLKHTGDFMIPRFKEICNAIMKLRDHKSKVVRVTVCEILPDLAVFCPDAFARSYLNDSIDILMKFFKSAELRAQVLQSLGKLCVIEGPSLIHRTDELLNIVKDALANAKKNKECLPEALVCIADMVEGLGTPFHDKVLVLLDAMISCGLNSELIRTVSVIVQKMPDRRIIVQQRILEEVTRVLGGDSKIYIPPPSYVSSWTRKTVDMNKDIMSTPVVGTSIGTNAQRGIANTPPSSMLSSGYIGLGGGASGALAAPRTPKATNRISKKFAFSLTGSSNNDKPSASGSAASNTQAIGITVPAMGFDAGIVRSTLNSSDVDTPYPIITADLIILCLDTLSNLTLPAFSLLTIVQRSILPYLDSDDERVRKHAAVSCSTILSKFLSDFPDIPLKCPTACATESIIVRLVNMVVADPSSNVRFTVLKSMSANFERFLIRSKFTTELMYLLSDESLEIRVHCLKLMGRLAELNPAIVLPPLRQILMQTISEIRNSSDNRSKEEATILLCTFMRCGPSLRSLVKSFVRTMVQSLQLTSDVRLSTVKLEALGQLSMVMGQEMLPYVDELMPVIVEHMLDNSSRLKQERAVTTLGQLVCATGCVVKPYLEYPVILPGSLDMLFKSNSGTNPWSFRSELLRTLGLIGALEPHMYMKIKDYLASVERKKLSIEKSMSGSVPSTADMINVTNSESSDGSSLGNFLVEEQKNSPDLPAHLYVYEQSIVRAYATPKTNGESDDSTGETDNNVPSSEDYCPKIAIAALMRILRDPSLTVHYSAVSQSIMNIFRSLGMKCVQFLGQIMPYLLQVVRTCGPGLRESILLQLSQLTSIVRHNLSPYLPSLFDIICEHWQNNLEHILGLVEEVAVYSPDEFRNYLPRLLPLIQSSLLSVKGTANASALFNSAGKSPLRSVERILACLDTLKGMLRPYLHLIIPSLCRVITQLQESGADAVPWLLLSVRTLRKVFDRDALLESQCHIASKIVHCLTKVIVNSKPYVTSSTATPGVGAQGPYNIVAHEAGKCLRALAEQLRLLFLPFDRLLKKSLYSKNLTINQYEEIVSLMNSDAGERGKGFTESVGYLAAETEAISALGTVGKEFWGIKEINVSNNVDLVSSVHKPVQGQSKLQPNFQSLQRSWDVSQRSTASDWNEWLRRFNVELLRESPSPALRACSSLAQTYPLLGKELFHAAFVSCWLELSETLQDDLVQSLQIAFRSPTMTPEILQILLNLAEFMEHDVGALPIPPVVLAVLAEKSRAYAKALHYTELEFQSNPSTCFESLININKKLDQHESALGVLKVVQNLRKRHPELASQYTVRDSWLAKLGHWNEALERYEKRLSANPKELAGIAGKLKCLEALGRWEECVQICMDHCNLDFEVSVDGSPTHGAPSPTSVNQSFTQGNSGYSNRALAMHAKCVSIGATAAWTLNQWDTMESFINKLKTPDSVEITFMRAALSTHREDFLSSRLFLDKTRKLLDEQLSGLLAESYGRAYMPLVMIQQCSELEEIIEYKQFLKDSSVLASSVTLDSLGCGKSRNNSYASLAEGMMNNATDDDSVQELYSDAVRKKSFLAEKWRNRILGCRSTGRAAIPVWRYLLLVRRMVLTDREDIDTWLEFAELCRSGENPALAERILNMHLGGTYHEYPLSRSGSATSQFEYGFEPNLSTPSQIMIPIVSQPGEFEGTSRSEIPPPAPTLGGPSTFSWGFGGVAAHSPFGGGMPGSSSFPRFGAMSPRAGVGSFDVSNMSPVPGFPVLNREPSGHMNVAPSRFIDRRVEFAILQQLWANGEQRRAIEGLESLLETFDNLSVSASAIGGAKGLNSQNPCNSKVQLECILRLGLWKILTLEEGGRQIVDWGTRKAVLTLYQRATAVEPSSYRAWHEWGLSNFRASEEIKKKEGTRVASGSTVSAVDGTAAGAQQTEYMVNAAKGLLRAISLGTRKQTALVTQDILCLLALWFRYVHSPELHAAISAGVSTVHIDNWLGFLPQLIARLDHPEIHARALLLELLHRLGAKHPQALVYPLIVSYKSNSEERSKAAAEIISSIRSHHPILMDQALKVAGELVRVAILWQETWHFSLEDASRQYFGEGNVQAMLDTLLRAHGMLNEGPSTMKENSFVMKYGQDLNDAHVALRNYMRVMSEMNKTIPDSGAAPVPIMAQRKHTMSVEETYLAQAWDLYYQIFKRINDQNANLRSLELQYCSAELAKAADLELAVPATYQINGSCVRIASFNPIVPLIRSKQHPRKIKINGEDGLEYCYLLKGQEDLRQDERAMQLFGLVNALFINDSRTAHDDLAIQRYAVIPLSHTAGLCSWVPKCDTLHDLIRDFRDSRKVLLNIESKLMQQMAPNQLYDQLTVIQKLEVFEYALANTTGEELAKVLWYRSETSEAWLEKRNNYTTSLAVMSMVGYILGLGDRHPSNLMLARGSGRIVHIDFGDCFEVAMHRDKFPERVPFRLTRMLVNAMEVSGIEGSYRFTCEKVMSILRENKDSLIATLEAFVHDPLISFRLLNHTTKSVPKKSKKEPVRKSSKGSNQISVNGSFGSSGNGSAKDVKSTESLDKVANPNPTQVASSLSVETTHFNVGNEIAEDDKEIKSRRISPGNIIASPVREVASSFLCDQPIDISGSLNNSMVGNEMSDGLENQGNFGALSGFGIGKKKGGVFNLETVVEDDENNVNTSLIEESKENTPIDKDRSDRAHSRDSAGPVEVEVSLFKLGLSESVLNTEDEEIIPQSTVQTPSAARLSLSEMVIAGNSANKENDTTKERVSIGQSYRPNLHLEIMSLAQSSIASIRHGNIAGKFQNISSSVHSGFKDIINGESDPNNQRLDNSITLISDCTYSTIDTQRPTMHSFCVSEDLNQCSGVNSEGTEETETEDELTARAVFVIRRVMNKLAGLDFETSNYDLSSIDSLELRSRRRGSGGSWFTPGGSAAAALTAQPLGVREQVDRIILQATSNENLCQAFSGWCPFW